MNAPRNPFACVDVAPLVIGPFVTIEIEPEPMTLVPPSGPEPTTNRLRGSFHSTPGGTSS